MKAPLADVQVFLALAETGHFTRAAERLNMPQSSLSAAIARFEQAVGARVFDRHTRSVELNEAGRALLPAAQRLVHEWNAMVDTATHSARHGKGRVGIAAPNAQCALMLPPLIRRFQQSHPGVRVQLHDVPEHQVNELVRNGVVDLGIATQSQVRSDLSATPFLVDQYVAVLPPGHALARKRSLEWTHLADEEVLGYLPDNPVRRDLDDRLASHGLKLNYTFEVALPWTMVGLVREGLGMAVLTVALRPLVAWHQLEVRTINRPSLARTMVLLRAPDRAPTAHATAFRDLILGSPARAARA
jgi:LysR family carnitine catabolism transcriptional activator